MDAQFNSDCYDEAASSELNEAYAVIKEAMESSNDRSSFLELIQVAVDAFESVIISYKEHSQEKLECEANMKIGSIETNENSMENELRAVNEDDLNEAVAAWMPYVLADETGSYDAFENGLEFSLNSSFLNMELSTEATARFDGSGAEWEIDDSDISGALQVELENLGSDTEESSFDESSESYSYMSYSSESSGFISDGSYELFESFDDLFSDDDDELW